MSTAVIKRFLILLSSAKDLERAQLYQLLHKAEHCYCLKDKRGQYEFGRALALFPPPFNLVGDYYQATYLNKIGQKQIAREKLERVREAGGMYSEKATLTLSGFKEREGDFDESLKLRFDLAKSESLPVVIESAIGVASILGSQGDHDKAREYLEQVLPYLSKLGPVPLYFDALNSYALELAELGKVELASEVITPVVLSPYTLSYPNWIESAQEIREKSSRRSIVAMNRSNVIDFPSKEGKEKEEPQEEAEPYSYPYSNYIDEEFRVQEKVEDWVYGATAPDDLGILMLALSETKDDLERDMIIGSVIDSTFVHSDEAKEAKDKWTKRLASKIPL